MSGSLIVSTQCKIPQATSDADVARSPLDLISDDVWGLIFALVDRREGLRTLSLVNKEWMTMSRSTLLSTMDVDETALLRLQHLQAETVITGRKLMLQLNGVKTLRVHFSQISLDQFLLLSTFLISSGACPPKLHVQGFISMESHARLAIKRDPVLNLLRHILQCVRELHLFSPRGFHQDGALWLWLCPQIKVLEGGAPFGPPWQTVDRLRPLNELELPGLQGLFASPSSRSVPHRLAGYVFPADQVIVGSDEDEGFLAGLEKWKDDGMTFNVQRLHLKELLCVPEQGCTYLEPLLTACSATLIKLTVNRVSDKGMHWHLSQIDV